jgi:hypothetical protein
LSWARKIETSKVFWASPGPYMEKSALLALGRNISGLELPPALYEGNTFSLKEPPNTEDDLVLSLRLREAILSSERENAKEK